jgi:hypothetical protein
MGAALPKTHLGCPDFGLGLARIVAVVGQAVHVRGREGLIAPVAGDFHLGDQGSPLGARRDGCVSFFRVKLFSACVIFFFALSKAVRAFLKMLSKVKCRVTWICGAIRSKLLRKSAHYLTQTR